MGPGAGGSHATCLTYGPEQRASLKLQTYRGLNGYHFVNNPPFARREHRDCAGQQRLSSRLGAAVPKCLQSGGPMRQQELGRAIRAAVLP